MTNDVRNQMKRARSVLAYRATHPDDFAGARASALAASVEEALGVLTALGADQEQASGHSLAGTAGLESLVRAVRSDLLLIRQTARTILKDDAHALAYAFEVPSSEAYDITISTGEAFYRELNQPGIAAKFLDWEIRPTFLTDLRADLDSYESVTANRDADTQGRKDAVRELDAQEETLIRALDGLDTLFRNKFQGDKTALATWREASHLERTRVRPKPVAPVASD